MKHHEEVEARALATYPALRMIFEASTFLGKPLIVSSFLSFSVISNALGAASTCKGFSRLSEIPGYSAKIQECEKKYKQGPPPDDSASKACILQLDEKNDSENRSTSAIIYRIACQDYCNPSDPIEDQKACYDIKANARKARAIAGGHSTATMDTLRSEATERARSEARDPDSDFRSNTAFTRATPEQREDFLFWKFYSDALQPLAAKKSNGTESTADSSPRPSSSKPSAPPPPAARSKPGSCPNPEISFPKTYKDSNGVSRACTQTRRKVHFTFDDGPEKLGNVTQKVLNTLKQKNVSATFFVEGQDVGKNLDLIKRMRNEGHFVGCHSHDHSDHSRFENAYQESREQALSCVNAGDGKIPPFMSALYRLPYGAGASSAEVKRAYASVGFPARHKGWDVDSLDWKLKAKDFHNLSPEAQKVAIDQTRSKILTQLYSELCRSGGGVLLFHDIHPTTAENVGAFIDAVRCQGFETGDLVDHLGSVPQLITPKGLIDDPRDCTPKSNPIDTQLQDIDRLMQSLGGNE